MKKIILSLIFVLTLTISFSQIFYSPVTSDMRYMGGMNNEVLSLLNERETQMYYECLEMANLHKDSVIWLEGEYLDKVFNNGNDYTFQLVLRDSRNNRFKNVMVEGTGKSTLPKQMCLIFMNRYEGEFKISIQKYY